MPYYRCRTCGFASYSAASNSPIGRCPGCIGSLIDAQNGALRPARNDVSLQPQAALARSLTRTAASGS